MALFSFKKNTKKDVALASSASSREMKKVVVRTESQVGNGTAHVALIRPRVTEKVSLLAEHSIYTFDIRAGANKNAVAAAVTHLYKVTPVKVRIVNIPEKAVFIRGKRGVKSGGRKAYVYLKKGEKIEIS